MRISGKISGKIQIFKLTRVTSKFFNPLFDGMDIANGIGRIIDNKFGKKCNENDLQA